MVIPGRGTSELKLSRGERVNYRLLAFFLTCLILMGGFYPTDSSAGWQGTLLLAAADDEEDDDDDDEDTGGGGGSSVSHYSPVYTSHARRSRPRHSAHRHHATRHAHVRHASRKHATRHVHHARHTKAIGHRAAGRQSSAWKNRHHTIAVKPHHRSTRKEGKLQGKQFIGAKRHSPKGMAVARQGRHTQTRHVDSTKPRHHTKQIRISWRGQVRSAHSTQVKVKAPRLRHVSGNLPKHLKRRDENKIRPHRAYVSHSGSIGRVSKPARPAKHERPEAKISKRRQTQAGVASLGKHTQTSGKSKGGVSHPNALSARGHGKSSTQKKPVRRAIPSKSVTPGKTGMGLTSKPRPGYGGAKKTVKLKNPDTRTARPAVKIKSRQPVTRSAQHPNIRVKSTGNSSQSQNASIRKKSRR